MLLPLKYLSSFWRNLELPLNSSEFSLMLTWSKKYVTGTNIVENQETKFAITDTKLYVSVVSLSN